MPRLVVVLSVALGGTLAACSSPSRPVATAPPPKLVSIDPKPDEPEPISLVYAT
jgi:hypothetical protein